MTAIEFRNVSKQYKSTLAVDSLNLSVEHGSIFGLIGRNGAGKTTSLRMMMGLSRPTSGEIYVYGEKSEKVSNSIGYLPDVPEFYNYLNAYEYLELCGNICGLPSAKMKASINAALEKTGMLGVRKRIGGYSRGMKQRLGIAQALLNNPKLIVLDEPTSALDPLGRRDVIDIIKSLRGEHTVLFSTHILPDVDRVCNSIAVMEKGQLIIEGTIDQIKQKYVSQGVVLQVGGSSEDCSALSNRLSQLECVVNITLTHENELTVQTLRAEEFSVQLAAVLSEMSIPLERYYPIELELESVFMEVLK